MQSHICYNSPASCWFDTYTIYIYKFHPRRCCPFFPQSRAGFGPFRAYVIRFEAEKCARNETFLADLTPVACSDLVREAARKSRRESGTCDCGCQSGRKRDCLIFASRRRISPHTSFNYGCATFGSKKRRRDAQNCSRAEQTEG